MEVRCEHTTSAPAQVVHSKSLGYWTPLRVCEFEPRHLHQKNFKKDIDKPKGLWYNKDSQGALLVEMVPPTPRKKIFEKFFKNPLTNLTKYVIIKTQRWGEATRKKGKPTRASKTSPPKTSHRKVYRFAVYKCEPEPRGWSNVGLCRLQSQK